MPVCKKCGIMQASADMRKSTVDGWLCKDKADCKRREKQRKAEQLRLPKEPPP